MVKKTNTVCWEDTVFEHRNKAYGAYILRYHYPNYLTFSALIVLLLFLAGMAMLQISGNKTIPVQNIKKVRVINYNELSIPPPIEKAYIPPKKKIIVKEEKMEKYVAPVVTQESVEEPEEMMTIEEVKELIASTDISTEEFEDVETIVEAPPEPEPEPVINYSRPAEFPGGKEALRKWLNTNMRYPTLAKKMGVEGKVVVEFIVGKHGKISEITVLRSLHRLCDREAVRLVGAMPDWIPAEIDGIKSSQKCTLSVSFVL